MKGTRIDLSPEEMQKLWELYKSGAHEITICNTFAIQPVAARRLTLKAAMTIGADEILCRHSKGDNDAPTS